MGRPLHVVILEDRVDDAELIARELRRAGFDPSWTRVDTATDLSAALDRTVDVVISDYSLPGFDAIAALELVHEMGLGVPVIVVSGVMSEETCVASLRCGAVDYLLKDRDRKSVV